MLKTPGLYDFPTKECEWCGGTGSVEVTREEFLARAGGAPVHEAFPNITRALREQVISGTHPPCWEAMFGRMER